MKSTSAGMLAHIQGEATTLATLWRIVRRDGTVFTFTDHDADIIYGGETYLASAGYARAAVSSGADLAVDETEISGFVAPGSPDFYEIRAGIWDHAKARLFAVNWANTADGEIKLRKATLGEFIIADTGAWRVDVRGLAQPLQQSFGGVYQPTCRAQLGDARCKIDLAYGAGWTQQDTIATVSESVTLVMSSALAGYTDAYFTGGVVIWQTGENAGVAREVVQWDQGTLTLSLFAPPPFLPLAGDVVNIQPGCDQRKATCQGVFDNYLNFRGEPFVPGLLALTERGQ